MRRAAWLPLAVCAGLAACAGDDGGAPHRPPAPEPSPPVKPAPDPPEPSAPLPFSATCALAADNALRAICAVTLPEPATVEVEFAPAHLEGPGRVHRSTEPATEHAVTLWFMEAETTYRWTVRAGGHEVAGFLATGDLPFGSDVRLMATGTPSAPSVGMVSPCTDGAYAVIVDTTSGRTVWYHPFASAPYGFMDGASFTEDRTVLTITDGQVVEADLEGRELLRLAVGKELPNRPHHDLFRKDGLTYVLFQEDVDAGEYSWMLDGFYVFDASEALLAEWHLADWFTPAPPVDGDPFFPEDTSHANAIWVGDDGTALFSMRHLSAIAAVRADPFAADFGEVLWRMSNPASEFGTDFTYTVAASGPADFERQHSVNLRADGRMLLFDNRDAVEQRSRAVVLSFDVPSGTAVFEQEHVLPLHCDYQGGAMVTPTGNTLATCAPVRKAYEFDPGGQMVWEAEAYCETGLGSYVPRFVPLDW